MESLNGGVSPAVLVGDAGETLARAPGCNGTDFVRVIIWKMPIGPRLSLKVCRCIGMLKWIAIFRMTNLRLDGTKES